MADYPSSIIPKKFSKFGYEYLTKISEFDSGVEQRRNQVGRKRYWEFEYEGLREDLSTVINFFKSKKGRAKTFTFNPSEFDSNLENEDITVRFDIDKLEIKRILDGAILGFSIKMIENTPTGSYSYEYDTIYPIIVSGPTSITDDGNYSYTATGGVLPYTWSVTNISGVSINLTTGVLTVNTGINNEVVVVCTDSLGNYGSLTVSINTTILEADDYTVLLIQSVNYDDGSIDFVDLSQYHHTVQQYGTSRHETDQYKFGSSSIYIEGGSNSYLKIPHHSVFDFQSNDFTIDMWIRPISSTGDYARVFHKGDVYNYTPYMFYKDGSSLYFLSADYDGDDWAIYFLNMGSFDIDTWNHFAVVRYNLVFYTYKNGVLVSSSGNNSGRIYYNDGSLYIGTAYNPIQPYKGYYECIRFSNIARWTSNFTPPSNPYV